MKTKMQRKKKPKQKKRLMIRKKTPVSMRNHGLCKRKKRQMINHNNCIKNKLPEIRQRRRRKRARSLRRIKRRRRVRKSTLLQPLPQLLQLQHQLLLNQPLTLKRKQNRSLNMKTKKPRLKPRKNLWQRHPKKKKRKWTNPIMLETVTLVRRSAK